MSKKATINTQTKVSKAPLPSVKISVKKSTKSKKPANDIKKIGESSLKGTINTQTKVSKAPLPSIEISVKKSTISKKPANDIQKIGESSLQETKQFFKALVTKSSKAESKSPKEKPKTVEPLTIDLNKLTVKEVDKPVEPEQTEIINMKMAVNIVFHLGNKSLNEQDKWPVFLDKKNSFSSFCRVRETRYVNCSNIEELFPDKVRLKILNAFYYGYPLVIDIGSDVIYLNKFISVCNEIDKNLYEDICNKEFVKNKDRYRDLIKETDENKFEEEFLGEYQRFYVVFVTSNIELEEYFSKFAIPFIIDND